MKSDHKLNGDGAKRGTKKIYDECYSWWMMPGNDDNHTLVSKAATGNLKQDHRYRKFIRKTRKMKNETGLCPGTEKRS